MPVLEFLPCNNSKFIQQQTLSDTTWQPLNHILVAICHLQRSNYKYNWVSYFCSFLAGSVMNCPLYYFEVNSSYICKIDGVLYFLCALLGNI